MAENINIGGRLHSTATGNVVAGANEIYDDTKGKKQSVVNAETDTALENRYTKSETYNKTELNNLITTPEVTYVNVEATDQTTDISDVLPATGAADTIYKIGSWDGSQYDASKYSEYAWNGSTYVYLATRDHGVDETPTPMSTNLVTSRGIYISKYVKLVSISATAAESGVQKVGDIYYASNTNLIRICRLFVSEGSASNRFIDTTPLYDTLYSIDGMLYEWNGTTLIPSTIHIYNIEESIKNDEGHIGIIKFKQGGYSGGDGSFNPNNTQRISSYPIYGGFKFTLKTGYKVTALCLFSNDGTFVRSIEGSDNKIEQGYYATITIGHNSSHPSGDNSKILPTEDPFISYISGQDYTNQVNDVDIKRTLQLIQEEFRQGGANAEDGSFNPNNSKRISTYPIYSGVKYTLATGYKVTVINKYSYDGTFVGTLDVSKTEHKVDNGYLIISIGHNANHASGDNSDIVPTETPFTSFVCGLPYLDYIVNSNKSDADNIQAELTDLSERVSLGFIQGGYSGATGELTPTNTKRISTTPIRYGAKYVLKSGYKISVIDRFADDGTFLGQSPVTGEISIDSGYFCMSIGHNYDNPNGNESVISPDENPFESIIFGDNYLHFNSSINNHTNWLSQYKESWSTLNCVPIFFKIANTSGSTFNLNIVIDTDFHYHLQYPERILQWTDWSVREAVKCFLCLGDMDLANSQPNKSIAMYNEHSQNVWNMFKSNKYNKAQLVTLGNHDLNLEAPVGQWATKAQQKAAYITPMIQKYGTSMGIVTDSNNSDGCYWYCDIQNSTNKVRIIGVDVFDYPTPTTNTSNIVTPDSADIDYDNNWVYWYFSDYIRDYPISGVANRRDLGLSVKQLQFIINALNTIPSGSTAIICGHTFGYFNADPSTISSLNETYWVGDSGRALLDIMKKFKEKGSGEYSLISPVSSTLQYDFTNAASNKVMMLQGHYHNFNKQVFEGIKLYTLIATDGNMNKPINLMSAKEACDILVMSNDGEDNADTIRFVRYGHVGRGTANLANDTDLTADTKGFHYIDNPESIYD